MGLCYLLEIFLNGYVVSFQNFLHLLPSHVHSISYKEKWNHTNLVIALSHLPRQQRLIQVSWYSGTILSPCSHICIIDWMNDIPLSLNCCYWKLNVLDSELQTYHLNCEHPCLKGSQQANVHKKPLPLLQKSFTPQLKTAYSGNYPSVISINGGITCLEHKPSRKE